MLNNCAGGITPWGTWLTCEENFNGYFWRQRRKASRNDKRAASATASRRNWYNWGHTTTASTSRRSRTRPTASAGSSRSIRSIPASVPVKRTALGRFKHEGAGSVVNKDGRFVVYSGDDERFDYVYKFVTAGTRQRARTAPPIATCSTRARSTSRSYNADGTGEWLPLVHGQGKLTAENGFATRRDVLINARLAGDALGATRMDRPEDIDVNPQPARST